MLAGGLLALLALVVGASDAQAQCTANCPLEATFDVSVSDILPLVNSDVTLQTTVADGNDTIRTVGFLTPPGVGVASDNQTPDGTVVGSVTMSADVGCDGLVDPQPTWTLRDANADLNKAEWVTESGGTWQFRITVDGNSTLGHQLNIILENGSMPTPMCSPQTFAFTFNSVVMTNPAEGTHTWAAVYTGRTTTGVTITRSDTVAIGVDTDGDLVPDSLDNCPAIPNPDQADADADGLGNVCDPDSDNDGYSDVDEIFITTDPFNNCNWPPDFNGNFIVDIFDFSEFSMHFDTMDGDPGYGRRYDLLPSGIVDIFDFGRFAGDFDTQKLTCNDPDGDGVETLNDNCPSIPNGPAEALIPGVGNQTDSDGDGLGDACDVDDDNDSFGMGFPLYFRDEIELFVGTEPSDRCSWPPDLNFDGRVDILDFGEISPHLGTVLGDPGYEPRFDLNMDNAVDSGDSDILVLYFDMTCF